MTFNVLYGVCCVYVMYHNFIPSPSPSLSVWSCGQDPAIHVWDVATLTLLYKLDAHKHYVNDFVKTKVVETRYVIVCVCVLLHE